MTDEELADIRYRANWDVTTGGKWLQRGQYMTRLLDEVERLRAEVEALKMDRHVVLDEVKRLIRENARLGGSWSGSVGEEVEEHGD